MKKIFKLMMMALAAIVLTIGFAACSSSDDDNDNSNSYTTSISVSVGFKGNVNGNVLETSLEIRKQIMAAYNSVGITDSFSASSDADVKTKAEQAEKKLTDIDWNGANGNATFSIKNAKSNQTIYSKTYSSTDSGSKAIK